MEDLIKLLSDSEQIQIILQNISFYIIYFYPGILSIYWTSFLEAKSTKTMQALILKGFSISFIYNTVLSTVLSYNDKPIEYNVLLILISVLCPYVYNKVNSQNYGVMCVKHWEYELVCPMYLSSY